MALGQARPSVAWATKNGLIWFVFLWTRTVLVVGLAHCPLSSPRPRPAWRGRQKWRRCGRDAQTLPSRPPAHIVVRGRGAQGLPLPSSKKGSSRRPTPIHPCHRTPDRARRNGQTDRQTDEWLALLALVNVLAARARPAAAAASAGAVSVVGKRVKGKVAEGERERESEQGRNRLYRPDRWTGATDDTVGGRR